jgi:hypothetical protein
MSVDNSYDPSLHDAAALLEFCYQCAVDAGPAPEGSRVLRSLSEFYRQILPFLESDHPVTEFLLQVCQRSNQLHQRTYPTVGGE